MDRAWHRRNRDYDRWVWWKKRLAQGLPLKLTGVPWDVVQDEFGVQAGVVLLGIVRVALRRAQDEMRRYLVRMTGEFGGLPPMSTQDEMVRRPP